ncbi:MAG: hypothetical protein ABJA71_06735 [Ginsengibacter sp.]
MKTSMKTTVIRRRLREFIDKAEEKKVKAMYTLFEDEILHSNWEYTDKFKTELDRRYTYYENGGRMINPVEADK